MSVRRRLDPLLSLAVSTRSYLEKLGIRPPKLRPLAELFRVVYASSLMTEERNPLRVRVTLITPRAARALRRGEDPTRAPIYVRFPVQQQLDRHTLAKLAMAADPFASSIAAVIRSSGTIRIHGLLDQGAHILKYVHFESDSYPLRPGTIDIEVLGPAKLRVWHRYSVLGGIDLDHAIPRPLDVLQKGPIAEVIHKYVHAQFATVQPTLPRPTKAHRDSWRIETYWHWIATLSRILLRIQRYGHGGAILLVPSASRLRDISIKYPVNYSRTGRALSDLAFWRAYTRWSSEAVGRLYVNRGKPVPRDLFELSRDARSSAREATEELSGTVGMVASLSRVDGAIVLDGRLCVLGFGAELRATNEPKSIWLAGTPVGGVTSSRAADPARFGTRHRSMFRYCRAHSDAIGFVVSQDGDIRCIKRIGTRIVCWENVHVWTEHVLPRPTRKPKIPALSGLPA